MNSEHGKFNILKSGHKIETAIKFLNEANDIKPELFNFVGLQICKVVEFPS